MTDPDRLPPIRAGKDYTAASVFTPANLLREARRQKGLAAVPVPEICVLDPDGDILRWLRLSDHARRMPSWACYHTDLYAFDYEGEGFGISAALSAPRSRCCSRKNCSPAAASFSSA